MVLTHWHIESVTICWTVHDCIFWPMLLTFRRSTFCCIHQCWTDSARTLVRLYRLLLIHCIYVSVTKPTCPAFSAWLNTCSVRSLKVTWKAICSVVWHYHQSYVQHYMANLMLVQCVITSHAEVWTCQFWWEFYKELTVTIVQVPEGTAVSTQCRHYGQ